MSRREEALEARAVAERLGRCPVCRRRAVLYRQRDLLLADLTHRRDCIVVLELGTGFHDSGQAEGPVAS